jgi:hypothetical protein
MANPMMNFSPGGAEDDFDDEDDDGFVLGCDNHLNNSDAYHWTQQNNSVIINLSSTFLH